MRRSARLPRFSEKPVRKSSKSGEFAWSMSVERAKIIGRRICAGGSLRPRMQEAVAPDFAAAGVVIGIRFSMEWQETHGSVY